MPRPFRRPATALVALLLAGVAACGGKSDTPATKSDSSNNAPTAGGAPATAPAAGAAAAAPATGKTVEVRMIGDDKGYRFEPATVTIHPGDAVRWVNVSGGPHNATFWADSIPAGAQPQLAANMPNTTAPLTGPLLVEPNATYVVSFAGAKPGVYRYYCTPHLALGMKAVVTVQ